MSRDSQLHPALVERVLAKLGLAAAPGLDPAGLTAVYEAWCRSVPFDNLRKLIHLRSGSPARLPGDTPEDFFEAWLEDGAGGTCWAGNGALCALLESLGFRARRGIATMLVAPNLPPNHGTVTVSLDGALWLVDASLLHGAPLRLERSGETEIAHPAWGVHARHEADRWLVRWRPAHRDGLLDCRIDSLDGSVDQFRELHEATRGWSPFNYALYARVNRGDGVLAAVGARNLVLDAAGVLHATPLDARGRLRFLVEEVGIGPALAARVPADVPMPPPPGAGGGAGSPQPSSDSRSFASTE